MKPVHPSRSKPGFTLVELLVVIGIIALLISILLPSLNAAREQGRTVKCLSNMKNMGLGMTMYMNDYKGRLMPSEIEPNGVLTPGRFWFNFLSDGKYLKATNKEGNSVYVCPSTDTGRRWTDSNPWLWNDAADIARNRRQDRGVMVAESADIDLTTGAAAQNITSYAVNGTFRSPVWWDATGATGSIYFPFPRYRYNADRSINTAPASNMFKVKQSTKVGLVFDGDWLFGQLPGASIRLRHGQKSGSLDLREKKMTCSWVMLDGHAESISGSRLPGENDDMWNLRNLNDTRGRWDVRFLTQPAFNRFNPGSLE